MDFLKNHYEKVIFGVILLALLAAVAWLPMQIGAFKERIVVVAKNPPNKEREPVDIQTNQTAIARVERTSRFNLDAKHNLFNPVEWQKTREGGFIKIDDEGDIGAGAVRIKTITPLYLRIEYQGVATTSSPDDPRYLFLVTEEADEKKANRSKRSRSAQAGRGNEVFRLVSVDGVKTSPSALTLELNDSGEEIVVRAGEPFEAVAGHMADLEYAPERKTKPRVREGDNWSFHRDDYKIVAIGSNHVVLSAQTTKKRTTIEWKPDAP